MSDVNNLNERDMHCYYSFLRQARDGFNNLLLDKSFNIINNFILNKYNSLDFPVYSLEDFLQECFAKIIKYNTVMSTTMINRVYNKLRNMDKRQSERELVSMEECSIDYDNIYFKMFMAKIIPMLNKESYQKILVTIINNNDLSVDFEEFGLSRQRISQIKQELFRRIKWNEEFREYYSDYEYDANMYYEQQLKSFSLKEYICSPKQIFRKEVKELITKYVDDASSLSKEELEEVLDILYRFIGRKYYDYHREEIRKRIGKIKKLIFDKSI